MKQPTLTVEGKFVVEFIPKPIEPDSPIWSERTVRRIEFFGSPDEDGYLNLSMMVTQ